MKLLSNFDTNLDKKLCGQNAEKYGKENVLLIKRHKYFFYLYVLLPIISFFIVSITLLLVGYTLEVGAPFNNVMWIIIMIFVIGFFLLVSYKVTGNYIDYQMDFAVITPNEIEYIVQTGLFNRQTEIIQTDKVKTININKKGIVKSMLDFGTIIFLSEGDDDYGDITLDFVRDPEVIRNKVRDLMSVNRKTKSTSNPKRVKDTKEKDQK